MFKLMRKKIKMHFEALSVLEVRTCILGVCDHFYTHLGKPKRFIPRNEKFPVHKNEIL